MGEPLEARDVIYCAKCGMPPEYCEYSPDFESHCDPWLLKNHPGLHAMLAALRTSKPKCGSGDDNDDGGEDETEKDSKPKEPWTTEERLTEFYKKYQPDKLDSIPSLLEKYAGKEDKLFVALVKKYGPEPEDPYYADSDEEDVTAGMEQLNVDIKKRRGKAANKAEVVETRVVIQKVARNKRKATTIVVGMETVPGLKLKDVSKAFSKRFAGSSSVKDGIKGKEIIIQGDHMEDVADMLVNKFQVPSASVFLDMDGEFVCYR